MTDDPLVIDPEEPDNGEEPTQEAFVFLKLFDGDDASPSPNERRARREFRDRDPACVSLSGNFLTLELTNIGNMVSDLVLVDWQTIYCSAEWHEVDDAFSANHAAEIQPDPVGKLATLSYVEPNLPLRISIELPEIPEWAYNFYFRARLTSLWEPTVPASDWDWSEDVKATEFYTRLRS